MKNIAAIKRNNRKIHARKFITHPAIKDVFMRLIVKLLKFLS